MRKPHRLNQSIIMVFEITLLAIALIFGTLILKIGPVVLDFGDGHGVHLGDIVLIVIILPAIVLLVRRLQHEVISHATTS